MRFGHWWMLCLALIPLAGALFAWRRTQRRLGLAVKALSLAAICFALAQPEWTVASSQVAVAVLADTSASISAEDLVRESGLADRIEGLRGRNWVEIMPFAASTRGLSDEERTGRLRLARTQGEDANATNIESAIRAGIAALPAGYAGRVVLISDGRENLGTILRGLSQARDLGIPIDTYSLAGRQRPGLRIESVAMPAQAFTGEKFPVDVVVSAPRSTNAQVGIAAGGKPLGASQVALEAGENHVRAHASVTTTGVVELALDVSAAGLGTAHLAQAMTLRQPRALVISQDPPGTGTHLVRALSAARFAVTEASAVPGAGLGEYQVVALNNLDLEGLPAARQHALEQFVLDGGGLIAIGGERNIYLGNRQQSAIDRTLPGTLAPPRAPEGTCVVLILDKSSSMEGRKMDLAKEAAIGVVNNLRPIDMVGVLIFDNSFHWAVPIRFAEERTLIKRIIAGIAADGGTQIAPALSEAYRRILPVNALYKHIVLLTDGISEEGDSLQLAREAAARDVTISTVGLGQDVNRSYLERVAELAGGKSHFLTDPEGLEQIVLRDVMEHTGATAVERQIRAHVARPAEILDGVGIETAPPLLGFVRFIAKPAAERILTVEHGDPLYMRWQYGLGRAAIFASDAKSRWAKGWVAWPGFDRLWANIFRDLLPHMREGEVNIAYDSGNDQLAINYRLARDVKEPEKAPDVFVFGPRGFQKPVELERAGAGAYRGRVAIQRRTGLFRVRPLKDSRAFPEAGFYREEPEWADYGADTDLLRRAAAYTGGRFNPDPHDVFDAGGRTAPSVLKLWPLFIALAILLNLGELVARKWGGIVPRRRARSESGKPAMDRARPTAA